MKRLFGLGGVRDSQKEAGGAVMVEFLIAYLPVLVSFLMFWQLGEILVAQMVVERASSVAGRAAVVVLPDDPAFYDAQDKGLYDGERKREIRLAAGMMLAASPHLSENFTVDVQNVPSGDDLFSEIDVKVDAEFHCKRLGWVCGADGLTVLSSTSQHTYHGAGYEYEPTDLSNLGSTNSSTTDPGCTDSDTPNSGGQGNHGSGGSNGGPPGKGGGFGAGGKGNGTGGRNSAGTGGAPPDSSGSCPAGQTANKDGSCSSSRGGPSGRCKDGSPVRFDGLCNDNTCPGTGKRPKKKPDGSPGDGDDCDDAACTYGPKGSKTEPTTNSVCPSGKPYLIGAADNTGQCCSKSKKRDSNGCEKYDCDCAPQTKAKEAHSSITASFSGTDPDVSANLSTGTAQIPSCNDTCSPNSGDDIDGLAKGVQDMFVAKQFNTMCGLGKYKSGSLLKKTRVQKVNGVKTTVVIYDTLSASGKAVWEAIDKYCVQVQTHMNDSSSKNPIASHLADDSTLQSLEGNLASLYGTVNGDDKTTIGNQLNGGNANHTEPKIIQLLKEWSTQSANEQPSDLLKGGTLTLTGEASPCKACAQDLAAFAKKYQVKITYDFDHVYTTGPARTDAKGIFLQGGQSWQSGSVELSGQVSYDANGNPTYSLRGGQEKLCSK